GFVLARAATVVLDQFTHDKKASEQAKRPLLVADQLADAALGERDKLIELRAAEGLAFRGALHFDEVTRTGHDDVHVAAAGGVFAVVQIEHGRSLMDADRN